MPTSAPEQAIRAFERATALRIALHAPEDPLAGLLDRGRFMHLQPICVAAKAQRLQRCIAIDGEPSIRATAAGQVRLKICHAGLVEWIAAVPLGQDRRWLLYAGARRAGPGLRPEVQQRRQPGPWDDAVAGLPAVDADESAWIAELLAQLRSRLGELLAAAAPRLATPAEAGSRETTIRRLIREYHVRPIRLADLARQLGLSPARAGHAVREACGAGFVQLLTAERLATAARMLRETSLPVEAVGRSAGFADLSRFHRCFRRRFGATPAAYRASAG